MRRTLAGSGGRPSRGAGEIGSPIVRSLMIGLSIASLASGQHEPTDRATPVALRSMVAAHGGLPRFESIRDWYILAEREIGSDREHEIYEEYVLRDEAGVRTLLIKRRSEQILVFGHDGEQGFAIDNGRRRSEPGAESEGYYRAHGEYYLRAIPFKWLDPGVRALALGPDRTGHELVELRAHDRVGRASRDVWVAAIDSQTRLLYEARLTHEQSQEAWMSGARVGVSEITYRYSDYREISGIQIPHRLEYLANGEKTGENNVLEVQLNLGLSSELFSPEAHLGAGIPVRVAPSGR